MNILALDLGTKMGWASLINGERKSGSVNFAGKKFDGKGKKYLNFMNWLYSLTEPMPSLDAIYYEDVKRHNGVYAAHAYGGFEAIITAWCEDAEVPYISVPVGTIKKHATGKGNADKDMMLEYARQLGYNPSDHNEADAIHIRQYALINAGWCDS